MIVDGIRYWWRYMQPDPVPMPRMVTLCFAKAVDADKDAPPLASSSTVQNRKDKCNQDVGRRVSLGRVLSVIYPLPQKGPHMAAIDMATYVHNKMMRANVWEAYRTLPDKPRWGVAKVPKTT